MEFKNGYKLIYEKNKKLYASKEPVPHLDDSEIDLGLTEEQIASIKLVYEKDDNLVASTKTTPEENPMPIDMTIDGESILGPSTKPDPSFSFTTRGVTLSELRERYPDKVSRFYHGGMHGDDSLPCFRFLGLPNIPEAEGDEIRFAYASKYADDYAIGDIIENAKEAYLYLIDSEDAFVGNCKDFEGYSWEKELEHENIVTVYKLSVEFEGDSVKKAMVLDKATAPFNAYMGIGGWGHSNLIEGESIILKEATTGRILQTLTYEDLHTHSEDVSKIYFIDCNYNKAYLLDAISSNPDRALWVIRDNDYIGDLTNVPVRPEVLGHKGMQAIFVGNSLVDLHAQEPLYLEVTERIVKNNEKLTLDLEGNIWLPIDESLKDKLCTFMLENNLGERCELSGYLYEDEIWDDEGEEIIKINYFFNTDYHPTDFGFSENYTDLTITYLLEDPLTALYYKDNTSSVEFKLWKRSGYYIKPVENGELLYSSSSFVLSSSSDSSWWPDGENVSIYMNDKLVAQGDYSYGYYFDLTGDLIEDGKLIIKVLSTEKQYIYEKGEDSDVDFDLIEAMSGTEEIIGEGTNLVLDDDYRVRTEVESDIYINGTLMIENAGTYPGWKFTLTEDMSVNNKVVITVKRH